MVVDTFLRGCTLFNNTVSSSGGGIYGGGIYAIFPSLFTMTNCTVTGNSTVTTYGYGYVNGGVINDTWPYGVFTMTNCTITSNSESGSSLYGSIYTSSAPFTLANSILWSNTGGTQISGSAVTASYSIIQGGYTGTGILTSDPLLQPLGNYGGATPTSPPAPNSPAIDTGLASAQTPAIDQRGILRDAQPDIGACELPVHVTSSQAGTTASIGDSLTLTATTTLSSATYQWYRGVFGDISHPIAGATVDSFTTGATDTGGDYWVGISAGGLTYPSATQVFTIRGTYQQWKTFHGLQGNRGNPDASPADDGVSNLIKYGTGLDPLLPANLSSYLQTSTDATAGTMNLDLTLSRTPTDLIWSILESQDLNTWSTSAGTTNPISSMSDRQTFRLAVPVSQSKDFFKVQFQVSP